MAIAIDQLDIGHAGIDTTATTIPFTTSQTVAANGFIVVCVGWGDSVTLNSVTGGGLTWTIDKQGVGANTNSTAVVSAQAPSGLASGTTLTANFSATTVGRAVCGTSFTGVLSASALDTTSGPTSFSATTAWTTASTTIAAGSVLVAAAHCSMTNDTSTITAPSVEAQDFGGGASTFGMTVGYRIAAAGGAVTVAGTWSGSENGGVNAAAYKVAPVTTTAVSPHTFQAIPVQAQGRNL